MDSHEIAQLKCPSCGSSRTGRSTPLAFGAEFCCADCGTTSVLIVNRALLPLDALQKSGERVCILCGRIALRDARFCQEGHALVRKCVNQVCLKEFAIDHPRCDFCGWLQQVKPDTIEGVALGIERAISDLFDPSLGVVLSALDRIRAGGEVARVAAGEAVPAILRVIVSPPVPQDRVVCFFDETGGFYGNGNIEWAGWQTIASLGSSASAAVPTLREGIDESWSDDLRMIFLLRCLAAISPRDALAYCERISAKSTQDLRADYAVHIAFHCGIIAIPVLQKFSIFLDNNGAKRAIRCLRAGYQFTMPRLVRGY